MWLSSKQSSSGINNDKKTTLLKNILWQVQIKKNGTQYKYQSVNHILLTAHHKAHKITNYKLAIISLWFTNVHNKLCNITYCIRYNKYEDAKCATKKLVKNCSSNDWKCFLTFLKRHKHTISVLVHNQQLPQKRCRLLQQPIENCLPAYLHVHYSSVARKMESGT